MDTVERLEAIKELVKFPITVTQSKNISKFLDDVINEIKRKDGELEILESKISMLKANNDKMIETIRGLK